MVGRCANVIVAGLLGLWAAPLDAQEPARNRLYGEFLGPGFAYSLNYERQVSEPISLRLGAGGWPQSGFQYFAGFGMALIRFGQGDHSAYLGAGGGILWVVDVDFIEATNESAGYAVGLVAYQFQPGRRGFFLRLSYTPLVAAGGAEPLWGGLTLGWAF
jgi:hypothetical protein